MSVDIVELRKVLEDEANRSADEKSEYEQRVAEAKSKREEEELQPFQVTATDFISDKIRHLLDHFLKYASDKGKALLKEKTGIDADNVLSSLKDKDPVAAARDAVEIMKEKGNTISTQAKEQVGTMAGTVKERANSAAQEAQTRATALSEKADSVRESVTSNIDNTVNQRSDDIVKAKSRIGGAAQARAERAEQLKNQVSSARETSERQISTARGAVEPKLPTVESYKFGGRNNNLNIEQREPIERPSTDIYDRPPAAAIGPEEL